MAMGSEPTLLTTPEKVPAASRQHSVSFNVPFPRNSKDANLTPRPTKIHNSIFPNINEKSIDSSMVSIADPYQGLRRYAGSVSYNETIKMVPDDRDKNSKKLQTVLILVILYFFAEIIAGYKYHCLALIADAFHMLTDAISLVIALYGIKVANKDSKENWGKMTSTFGWGRAEVIATLLNAVFLMVICLKLMIEAIERLCEPEAIIMPKIVFYVATGGLLINIAGLILLNGDHGHSHGGGGGHGHSHGPIKNKKATKKDIEKNGHCHSHENSQEDDTALTTIQNSTITTSRDQISDEKEYVVNESHTLVDTTNVDPTDEDHSHSHDHNGHDHDHSHEAMNMKAVYLHVIGDFLGSIIVMLTNGLLALLSCDFVKTTSPFSSNTRNNNKPAGLYSDNYTQLWFGNLDFEESIEKSTNLCENFIRHSNFTSGTHINADCLIKNNYLPADGNCWDIGNGVDQDPEVKDSSFNLFGCYRLNDTMKIIHYTEPSWTIYLDPLLTMALVILLACWNLPYVKQPISILLETVPANINKEDLEKTILQCKNICALHCLHLWRFDEKTVIASLHVQIRSFEHWSNTMQELDGIFAELGIYSVTVQPSVFDLKYLGITADVNEVSNQLGSISENAIAESSRKEKSIKDHIERVISYELTPSKKIHAVDKKENSPIISSPITHKTDDARCCSNTAIYSDSINNLRQEYSSRNNIRRLKKLGQNI